MNIVFKIVYIFAFLDMLLLAYGATFQNKVWLLNTQIAYFSALLVMLASFWGYTRKVMPVGDEESVDVQEAREPYDMIGDKYGVFDDEEYEQVNTSDASNTAEKGKETLPRKERMKRFFSKLMLGSQIFFSIYRLIAYGLLIGGVFYLIRQGEWQVFPYILGTTLTMFGLMIAAFILRSHFVGNEG